MSLIAFDTCDCCGGSGARRMAGSSLFFCEDCNDEFSFDEGEIGYGPPQELQQILADALADAEQVATPPNPNHNKNPQSDGGKG